MAVADYKPLAQQLYISYFGRPADTFGLENFAKQLDALKAPMTVTELNLAINSAGNDGLKALVNSFSGSAESAALYGTGSTISFVTAIYTNLLNRAPDYDGLVFWVNAINNGQLTKANASLAITSAAMANTTDQGILDGKVVAAKVAVAQAFVDSISTGEELAAYSGDAAAAAARLLLSKVTADTTVSGVQADIDATLQTMVDASVVGQTYVMTSGIDKGISFTGAGGGDMFDATKGVNGGATLGALDVIDGGNGKDELSVAQTAAISLTASTIVKNVETANLVSSAAVAADTSAWTGLTALNVNSVGGETVVAQSTTVVTAADSALAAGTFSISGGSTVTANVAGVTTGTISLTGGTDVNLDAAGVIAGAIGVSGTGKLMVKAAGVTTGDTTVNGGTDVNVAVTGSGDGDVVVGTTTAPSGTVMVSKTISGAVAAGSITVKGGSAVTVTQTASNAVNTTQTLGAVAVTGTAATKSVSVTGTATATAAADRAGVTANTITVTDVNNGSDTKAGTITSVTADSYTTLTVNNNALTTLSVANGSGNIIIGNGGLTTATNKTLALSVNGLTGGTLDDADIYTTLNVTTTGADSTLANITDSALANLNVAGTKKLTLTSTAGLSGLKAVVVSGSAGITADLSGATVTSVSTAATTGTSTVTVDASKATFTGGAGVDSVTVATGATKAISLAGGDDSLTLGALVPTAAISGGTGTDTLSITATAAATASGSGTFASLVTGFEKLVLTAATNNTIDLAALGNFNDVTTSGGNGLTLSNMSSGGKLTLNDAGTAYTVSNASFTAAASDVLNVALTDGSGGAKAFASTGITAANVETINITVADTQSTPSGSFNDTLTLLAANTKTITVSGNAGLTLTATTDTALTSLDASGITKGGFTFTSGALAAAATIKGSASGANTVTFSAATGGDVTYTGGSGADVIIASNGKNNVITLGDGANSVDGTTGNMTITAGKDADSVELTSGNNTVNLGNGANDFTATSGNNTYVGGADVDTVTVGSGVNSITTGAGADVITITAAGANVNTYSTILDATAGDKIGFANLGTETFVSAKISTLDAGTAVFQDFANAVVAGATQADHSVNGAFGWFQFNGNTYLVEVRHDTTAGAAQTFVNGTDMIVKLTGLVDLSTATGAGTNVLTLA